MENKIIKFIKENNLLNNGERIIIALSGGADSVALLRVLFSLSKRNMYELFAAHVNHGLRGAAADSDELFCVSLCAALGIPIRVYKFDVAEQAKKKRLTIEEAGRAVRYEAFHDALNFFNANKIAVAHNKNDQTETVLMRLLRGTGLTGLLGIPVSRENIVRPLLCVTRDEIETYLYNLNQLYKTDETNMHDDYTRNKIRHHLIPLIQEEINPSIIETLYRFTFQMKEDNSFMKEETSNALRQCKNGDNSLNINSLITFHPSIVKRIIRQMLENSGGTLKDFSSALLTQTVRLLYGQTGKKIMLPDGFVILRQYDSLIFMQKHLIKNDDIVFSYNLIENSPTYIKETGAFALFGEKYNKIENIMYTNTFDYDKINGMGIIRSRKKGDIIYIQKVGKKKIKDYLIDRKISRVERTKIHYFVIGKTIAAIISTNNRVTWTDERYTANNDTKNKIILTVWEETNE